MSGSHHRSSEIMIYLLRKILREDQINQFIEQNNGAEGIDFIDKVFAHFNVGYTLSSQDRLKVPAEGPLLIVANHPIGSLDGLVLLRLISEIRLDVKIVVNDLLTSIEPLSSLMLPVDNMTGGTSKQDLRKLYRALKNNEALIIFPAGEVSRMNPRGIHDGDWNDGFVKLAKRFNAPVLPVHIGTRNSSLFYLLSAINSNFGTLLLVREMFNKDHTIFPIKVGELIGGDQLNKSRSDNAPIEKTVQDIRHSVYQLNKSKRRGKRSKADSGSNMVYALPENRKLLKKEFKNCEKLGQTRDGKIIYLYDYFENSAVMREIGRLRELTFRAVGEGSGRCRDLDTYDRDYRHIVLWDDNDLEIVGSYRIGEGRKLIEKAGMDSLYINTLFELNPGFQTYVENGIELGRSFVQPQYWGKRSLDYLWYGIGAYLNRYPDIAYMFGPVSISNEYPDKAKQQLVQFYSGYFPDDEKLAVARSPYKLLSKKIPGESFFDDFVALKSSLKTQKLTVPTLYKQYTEVCDQQGVRFIDFNVDHSFGDCVDGLILIEVAHLKATSVKRYIHNKLDVA
ncbi:MAG: lysophospholipid acyltransferase family protein [Pseudomonadales bacterium]|nr:lysophospholipid acyltransferase family protein [Pseudomonadales bacterium]